MVRQMSSTGVGVDNFTPMRSSSLQRIEIRVRGDEFARMLRNVAESRIITFMSAE
jgi:hypothetical protein